MARALSARDADAAIRALEQLRGLDADVARLNDALSGADEVVTLAPVRWHRRAQYQRYARSAEHLERVILYARSVARRSATTLQYGEPIPAQLSAAIERLGDAVRELHRSAGWGGPERSRQLVRESAELAGRAWAEGVRSYGDALITDVRTADSELLRATGYEPDDANRMVRQAAGRGQAAVKPPVRPTCARRAGTRGRPAPGGTEGRPAGPTADAGTVHESESGPPPDPAG